MTDPRFTPTSSVKFDQDKYTDTLYDIYQMPYESTISYEAFYYDGALRITKLEVTTQAIDPQMNDQLLENIRFRNGGKNVVIECTPEYK